MKTDDIKKMGQAYVQVLEVSMKAKKSSMEPGESKAHERSEKENDVEEALTGNQHKLDVNKNGKIDSHDFKLLKKTKKEEVESTGPEVKEWTVFNRIQEKLSSYKVSSVGDDPHDITTVFAIDSHTKGATPPEEINSKASQGEKDFAGKHGGLGKKTPPHYSDDNTIDQNPVQFKAQNVKVAPGRHNDSTIGDKAIIKSKS